MAHKQMDYTSVKQCPVEAVLDLVDGKWKGIILYLLGDGRLRFGELHRRMSGVTQRVLTKQLRELEAAGLIARHVYAEVPPRVEYELTPLATSLTPILLSIKAWGMTHLEPWSSDARNTWPSSPQI